VIGAAKSNRDERRWIRTAIASKFERGSQIHKFFGGETMATKVIDPVCGMEVDPDTAEWKTEYKGQTYYFCAPGCQRTFEKDPEKFLQNGSGSHNDAHTHH
jgi:YHS domain-containing protein